MRNVLFDFNLTVLAPLSGVALVSLVNSIRSWLSNRRHGKLFTLLSAGSLLLFIGFIFLSERIQLNIAWGIWRTLYFASFISFLCACGMAWHYADEQEWLNFAVCILALLLTSASALHFIHQQWNVQHVLCPHCGDDTDTDE